jgi:hypothetical protein
MIMKKETFYSALIFSIAFFASQAFALVDYSENEVAAPAKKNSRPIKINKRPSSFSTSSAPKRSGGGSSFGEFSLNSGYQSSSIEVGDRTGKINSWHFDGHFQTNYGFYINASHYMASSESESLAANTGTQQGNPRAILGFNWLRFGSGADAGSIDILAGASLGQTGSDFASQRTDKIFGIETTKKMASMVLGLGYEYRITGASKDENELAIGNIQKIYAILGWMATPDIRFSVEGGTYKIGEGTGDYSLVEKTSFGYVSPKVHLSLSPIVSLELGAIFRSKRLKNESLVDARLYDLKGAYGSSILAGLSLSM